MSDEQAAIDRIGRYWDAVARGDGAVETAIDPALAATIRRVHDLAAEPPAEARERVWQSVLANEEAARRQDEGSMPRMLTPNGRALDVPGGGFPDEERGRQRWFLAQLATAALLVLTLVGSFMVFGPGPVSRREEPPVFIPAIEATPATPDVAETPVAEFLWLSDGGPDFPFGEPSYPAIDPHGKLWVADGQNHRFLIYAPDGVLLEAWGTAGTGAGEFDFTWGGIGFGAVAFDDTGNIYVADTGNTRIQKFSPDRTFLLAWGSRGNGDEQFQQPLGVAVDAQGRVVVSDGSASTLQVFDREGQWIETWARRGRDPGQVNGPGQMAIDTHGNVWVTEFNNARVQKFSPDGESLLILRSAGAGGGQFASPTGVATDTQDRVFVADRALARVQIFSPEGALLGAWGEFGAEPGQFQGSYGLALDGRGAVYVTEDTGRRVQAFRLLPPLAPDAASARATPTGDAIAAAAVAEFVWQTTGGPELPLGDPYFLTLDPEGNLWVPDGLNNRFQIFSPDGEFLAAWGEPGSGNGQFDFGWDPYGVGAAAFDAEGNLYVADHGNGRVQKFGPDRAFLMAWDGSESVEGKLVSPLDVAIGADGNVYVSDIDDDYVKVFDDEGRFLFRWGGLGASDGKFMEINGLDIDDAGNVWVVDAGEHRIQKFASDGAFLDVVGGYGPEEGEFRDPSDVTVDAQGRVYVTDWDNNRVQVFDGDGQFLTAWGEQGEGEGQFQGPAGIVLDGLGHAYVSDDGIDDVLKFRLLPPLGSNEAETAATPAATAGAVAELVWQTEGGPDLPLDDPYKIGIDPAGNLWIPDGRSHRFQIFSPEGEFLETWGKAGSGEGEFDFVLGGVGAGAVIWDEDGNIYVADIGNHRIQKFAPDRSFIAAWGEEGMENGQFMGLNDLALDREGRLFAIDGGRNDIQVLDRDGRFLDAWGGSGTGAGQFRAPVGIAIDGAGNLYISEYEGHRIQKLSPDGTPLAVWGSYGTEAGAFMNPEDVIVDAQGRVFVTEWSNHRVQVFDADGRFLAIWGSTAGIGDEPFANPVAAALDGKGFIYVSDGGSNTVFKFRLLPPLTPG